VSGAARTGYDLGMRSGEPLHYTENEVRSFLPTGWDLAREGAGAWHARDRAWRLRVIDNVDFDWDVEVEAEDAAEHGRLAALRRAMNQVYRERLG
jgi:hypothetical protein